VDISAIVVAAGRGTRMRHTHAKAFLPLGGKPMAVHCLHTLSHVSGLTSITLVVASEHSELAASVLSQYGPWPTPIRVAAGGAERQDSVAAGLRAVDPFADLVIVHDAARPFVSASCVSACIDAAAITGAAIVAVPAQDTVKIVDAQATITQTLDRRSIWLAQTPQVFHTALLRRAHEQARRDGYSATDDATLVERLGAPVRVVPGEPSNRKITTPDDLQWAEWHLESQRRNY
jgi:2-C-methyl-D-erythritol 4-phosphate cytidylyltransferase